MIFLGAVLTEYLARSVLALGLLLQKICRAFHKLVQSKTQAHEACGHSAAFAGRFRLSCSVRLFQAAEAALVVAPRLPRLHLRLRSPSRLLPTLRACSSVKHFRSQPQSTTPPIPLSPGASTASPAAPLKPARFLPMDSIPPQRTFLLAEQYK